VTKQRRRISSHPGASTCIPRHRSCQNALRQNHSSLKNLPWSFQSNQQYSITVITDGSGAIVERYAYSAYGTPTITYASGTTRTTTAIGNRYTYTGREWDETISLYHYRARMYDSVGGRFCSRDPIGYVGTQHNLFEYVHSRPVRAIDPSGLVEVVPTTMHPPTTNSNPVQIDFSNEPRSYARCGFVNFSSKMSVPQGTGPGTIIVYTYLTCLVGCPKQEPYTYRELKAFPVANDPIDLSFDYNNAS